MINYQDVFEVERGFMNSSLDGVNGEFVKTKDIIDNDEKSRKMLYQIFELFIYFGWPMIFSFFVYYLLPQIGLIAVGLIFLLMVFWPIIKGRIGLIIATKKGIKDPRHAIRSSSFWCDGFMIFGVPTLREVRQNSALSQSLDCIYNLPGRFGVNAEKFTVDWWKKTSKIFLVNILTKCWSDIWFQMPIAQDVRTRLSMVAIEIERMISQIYEINVSNGYSTKTIKIALLAGGTKQDIVMAVAKLLKKYPEIKLEIVCIEPDGRFAIKRSRNLIKQFNIPEGFFVDIFERTYVEPESRKTLGDVLSNNGYDFESFDLVVCIGLGDYQYGKKIDQFVKMLDNGHKIITANVSGNFIERFSMHVLMQWPRMQYLSLKEYKKILIKNLGLNRKITIYRTPNKVFNIAVVE